MTVPLKYPGLEEFPGDRNDPDIAELPSDEQIEHREWCSVADWTSRVGDENECKTTIWSMYEIRDFGAVAHEGTWVVKYDGGWGIPGEETITNPTYMDLWKIADRLIRLSGDLHHVFIEAFNVVKDDELNILDISTGS